MKGIAANTLALLIIGLFTLLIIIAIIARSNETGSGLITELFGWLRG